MRRGGNHIAPSLGTTGMPKNVLSKWFQRFFPDLLCETAHCHYYAILSGPSAFSLNSSFKLIILLAIALCIKGFVRLQKFIIHNTALLSPDTAWPLCRCKVTFMLRGRHGEGTIYLAAGFQNKPIFRTIAIEKWCAMMTLDIRNLFNSIGWSSSKAALVKLGAPGSLYLEIITLIRLNIYAKLSFKDDFDYALEKVVESISSLVSPKPEKKGREI